MSNRFFVTGLPRSRTAWLANLLTWGDSICYHELMRKYPSVNDYIHVLTGHMHPIVGDSSCGLLPYWKQLRGAFPDAKWVVIDRPPYESLKSCRKAFPSLETSVATIRKADYQLCSLVRANNALVVPYDKLNDSIPNILDYLGLSCPIERITILKEMNVQIQLSEAIKTAAIKAPPSKQVLLSADYVKLIRALCGSNDMAFCWLVEVLELALVWDHIIDDDPLDKEAVNRTFESCLLRWPLNRFFVDNAAMLIPTLNNSIMAWKHGDAYKCYVDIPLSVAFVLGDTRDWHQQLTDVVKKIKVADDLEERI